jgi:hypothetical protein
VDSHPDLNAEDVPDGAVDKVARWLAGVDHEAVSELHRLGTSCAEFAGDDDFTALGAGLHDESEDTVAGPGRVST